MGEGLVFYRPIKIIGGISTHPPDHPSRTIETRPEPITLNRSQDLRRWYWLKSELIALARHLGIHTGGGKNELTERIAAKLDGKTLTRPTPPKPAAQPLSGPLSPTTVIPNGQRLTQALRDFFAAELGPDFRFDGHMRQFMAQGAGKTLGEALEHWKATRHAPPSDIGTQFELNRFTRQWFKDHPGGSRQDMLAAWEAYRRLPTDARSRA